MQTEKQCWCLLILMRSWSSALPAGCLEVGGYIIHAGMGMNELLFLIWIIISTCIIKVGLGGTVVTVWGVAVHRGSWLSSDHGACWENIPQVQSTV